MLIATTFGTGPELQLFNLLTGVMADQPVTLGNKLSVGGDLRNGAALQVYGGLEVYASRSDAAPSLSVGPGGLDWGDHVGGLRRLDSGALSVGPLIVEGSLTVTDRIIGTLDLQEHLSPYLSQLRAGVVVTPAALSVGNADPWSAGITAANLVVRAPDLSPSGQSVLGSFECWSGNWLQFNVRVYDDDRSQGWQSKRLTLDWDADTQPPGSGGRLSFKGGKIGIGQVTDVEGAILELQRRLG